MLTMKNATLVGLALLAVPVAVQSQRGMGPRQGMGVGNPVAPLIEMRRELNLSTRQLVQLDSIERALFERNRTIRERMRSRTDSVRPRMREMTDEQRQTMRARADSMRALRQQVVRNDSTARAAAMRVLTDSQRTRVQVRQAERRGFLQGRAAAGARRGFQQGGGRARPGVRPMQPGRPGGRLGGGGAGVRPRGGPPAAGMGFGPRFQGRRPMGGQPGPMGGGFRRMGPPPDGFGPPAGAEMAPRRRRMMSPDGLPADPVPPVRRPPADSGR
jgi:hypothetical protein